MTNKGIANAAMRKVMDIIFDLLTYEQMVKFAEEMENIFPLQNKAPPTVRPTQAPTPIVTDQHHDQHSDQPLHQHHDQPLHQHSDQQSHQHQDEGFTNGNAWDEWLKVCEAEWKGRKARVIHTGHIRRVKIR